MVKIIIICCEICKQSRLKRSSMSWNLPASSSHKPLLSYPMAIYPRQPNTHFIDNQPQPEYNRFQRLRNIWGRGDARGKLGKLWSKMCIFLKEWQSVLFYFLKNPDFLCQSILIFSVNLVLEYWLSYFICSYFPGWSVIIHHFSSHDFRVNINTDAMTFMSCHWHPWLNLFVVGQIRLAS